MLPVPQLVQMRRARRRNANRNPSRKAGMGLAAALSLLIAVGGILGVLAYSQVFNSLPSLEALPALVEPPDGPLLQPTRLLDRSGAHVLLTLENPAAAGRQYLVTSPERATAETPLAASSLISTTLAAQDPSFWQHPGVSWASLMNGGSPTLAEQLAANLLLAEEPAGLRRLLRRRLLAVQLTGRFGRERILEWYLNTANYGRLAYGADAAARVYLGKPASALSLAEAAVLAAAAQAPALNPLDAPQVALENQRKVLQLVNSYKLAEAAEVQSAMAAPLELRTDGQEPDSTAPAFTRLALEQLRGRIPTERVERGGLDVITTLDSDLQGQAACLAAVQVSRLQPNAAAPSAEADCPASRLLSNLPPLDGLAPASLQAEAAVLDPLTGQILALVANPASGEHPAGSLAAPFVYLTAFARGLGPASLVWDIPSRLPAGEQANFDGRFHGPVRLRIAAANDYQAPLAQVLAQAGPFNAWRTAREFGLGPFEFPGEPQALLKDLAAQPVDLLSAVRAFGALANQGTRSGQVLDPNAGGADQSPVEPAAILRLEDRYGQAWLDWTAPVNRLVSSPQLAYLVTDVLSDEPARWPSLGHPNPLEIGRPAAVQIGRTPDGSGAWTVGYTPDLVAGAWIGGPEAQPAAAGETLSPLLPTAAAGLWRAVLLTAAGDRPSIDWAIPSGVSTLAVCDPSGLLPTEACPAVVDEVFLDDSQPLQRDNLYQAVPINRETGLRATIFTPPDLVEDRVYLQVPPEALEWARQVGLELPPDTYDVIPAPASQGSTAFLLAPAQFSVVRGQVEIRGTAGGAGFSSYYLQAGEGLYPRSWLEVGAPGDQPVDNDRLATWDTTGLDGLYSLQLLVSGKEGALASSTIQVTVDNQPPQVQALNPEPDRELTAAKDHEILLRADCEDNLGISSLAFYLDGDLLGKLNQAPFALPWQATSGTHMVRVVATDQAGNTAETQWSFSVQ